MEKTLSNKQLNVPGIVCITDTENSVVSKKKPDRKQSQQKKRRRSSSSSENGNNFNMDESMEKKLQEIAKKNNLNSVEMRKLIKNLVCNEHFLALVEFESANQQKEQNEEPRTDVGSQSVNSIISDIIESKLLSNIKLTRSKVKKLKQGRLFGLPSLSEPAQLEPEVAALISAELHSDEDDEEYCPREEEFLSDEDPNTTVSDIESQPRTPIPLLTNSNGMSPEYSAVYTSDGLFKIPNDKNEIEAQDEIIAKRTRSKLSLEQTPIEIIESNFHPPDSTQDLYETVLDQEWLEFLNDFNKPMNTAVVTDDDDPVADPEYIAGEKVPMDAEELRNVNISKKEINDLITELFSSLVENGVDLDEMDNLETSVNHLPTDIPKLKKIKLSDNSTSTVVPCSISSSLPSINADTADVVPNSGCVSSYITLPSSCLQMTENSFIADTSFNLNFNNQVSNGLTCSPKVEMNSKTIEVSCDKTKAAKSPKQKKKPKETTYELPDSKEYVSIKQAIHKEYIEKFAKLKYIEPISETVFNEQKTGMTCTQNLILQEQLRIHVQFLTQNFIQTYASPIFYHYAYKQKEMLLELQEECNKLKLNVVNLTPAVNFINNWEQELSEDNDKNSEFMNFINKELERTEQKSTHSTNIMKFPPRIMHAVLNCNYVFLYPQYLPRIPFRTNVHKKYLEFAPSETYIIAYELEKYMEEAKLKGIRKKKNPVIWACERMSEKLITGKTGRRIYDFVKNCLKENSYNPIKYYFDKGKAFRFSYNPPKTIEQSDLVPLRFRADSLPLIWKKSALLLECVGDISGDSECEQKQSTVKQESPIILVNYIIQDRVIQPSEPKNISQSTSSKNDENDDVLQNTQLLKGQKFITDFFNKKSQVSKKVLKKQNHRKALKKLFNKKIRKLCIKKKQIKNIPKCLIRSVKKNQKVRKLKKVFMELSLSYIYNVEKRIQKFKNKTIQRIYKSFYTLELYSSFLIELKMNCKRLKSNSCEESSCVGGKRVKQNNDDEKFKSKKAHRQEECLKHMLLPDKKDDANKKDAIYAFNFYDKVEETFKNCNKVDKFCKFENILKSFNPLKDSAAILYNKLEKIFLPENPELAEILLTFLLPSEAAEVGKFFAHFMVTNAGNFINKLNVYFNKQPAQLKKIYNCLSELADDPDVSIDKIKTKIVPLLKGNQFLLEWFLQLFPSEKPSESLYNIAETVTLKDIETNNSKISYENVPASDLNDDGNEDTSCQLKYINGRIYYGYKIPLPAKLAFMANENISDDEDDNEISDSSSCVHGISDFVKNQLRNAHLESCEDEKSEDEDFNHKEVTNDPYEICDDTTLLAHAKRLNPSLYTSVNFNQHQTYQIMHNKWKATLVDCKLSPKKCFFGKATNSTYHNGASMNLKERRKSPKKTIIKSPNCGKNIASHSISSCASPSSSNAIATAKKLKSLVEDYQPDNTNKLTIIESMNDDKSDAIPMKETLSDVVKKEYISDSIKINKTHDLDDNNKENTEGEDKITHDECKMTEECNDNLESSTAKRVVWKRDEDKIILEESKRGYDSEDKLISRIHQKMSYRLKADILDRHKFLLAVLSKLRT